MRANAVSVLPMQEPLADRAWAMEVCPASTLIREDQRRRYKGKGRERRNARVQILAWLERDHGVLIPDATLESKVLRDEGGDALDSMLAAFAVFRALREPDALCTDDEPSRKEGFVYA